ALKLVAPAGLVERRCSGIDSGVHGVKGEPAGLFGDGFFDQADVGPACGRRAAGRQRGGIALEGENAGGRKPFSEAERFAAISGADFQNPEKFFPEEVARQLLEAGKIALHAASSASLRTSRD